MNSPSRILIRAPNWIGDQILAYPFFHYLRERYPKSHIGVVCVPWVEALQYRNLVDEVIVLSPPREKGLKSRWNALEKGAEKIRHLSSLERWDLGILLPQSFSAAWLFYRARVRRISGYQGDGRTFLLQDALKFEDKGVLHRGDSYLKLLNVLPSPVKQQGLKFSASEFWGIAPKDDLDPGVPGALSEFPASLAWPSHVPFMPPHEPYYVIAPGATAESRRWSVDRFAALSTLIFKKTGIKGLILGGPQEKELAKSLLEKCEEGLEDWTARGAVPQYSKVFQQARFSLCNDSGLAHVASLCGSRVFIVWGAGHPVRTRPIGPGKASLVLNPVDCWPCERNQCLLTEPGKKLQCLRGIDVELVWKEIESEIRF